MSTLELPRVDGIYDSPLGSVCYHVDDLAFSEFVVKKDGLRVANQTGENGERAGFGSTVSIEGIRTKMRDIKFAYCEHPKNWGVVDGEGLCTVKVDGARVGISYDIVVNTPELMRLVNQASSSPRTRRRSASSGTRSRSDSREEARRRTRRTTPQLTPTPRLPRRTRRLAEDVRRFLPLGGIGRGCPLARATKSSRAARRRRRRAGQGVRRWHLRRRRRGRRRGSRRGRRVCDHDNDTGSSWGGAWTPSACSAEAMTPRPRFSARLRRRTPPPGPADLRRARGEIHGAAHRRATREARAAPRDAARSSRGGVHHDRASRGGAARTRHVHRGGTAGRGDWRHERGVAVQHDRARADAAASRDHRGTHQQPHRPTARQVERHGRGVQRGAHQGGGGEGPGGGRRRRRAEHARKLGQRRRPREAPARLRGVGARMAVFALATRRGHQAHAQRARERS